MQSHNQEIRKYIVYAYGVVYWNTELCTKSGNICDWILENRPCTHIWPIAFYWPS